MKRMLSIFFILWSTLCSAVAARSAETALSKWKWKVDSLNEVAYAYRYRDLNHVIVCAEEALQYADSSVDGGKNRLYLPGRVEAMQLLAFGAFMQMDFERAMQLYAEIEALTDDKLELLIVNVGRMKVCQRTALNKEFYDYRYAARHLLDELALHPLLYAGAHRMQRFNHARSEYDIVTAVYHYYLQQHTEAKQSMRRLFDEQTLAADTVQWLYYHYIKGAAQLCDGLTPEDDRLREFDELYAVLRIAQAGGYDYFTGNSLQGIANLMVSDADYNLFKDRRPYDMHRLSAPLDSLLPFRLAQQSMSIFRRYGDLYQTVGAYVTMGRYLNARRCYAEALDTLTKALDCINLHHTDYYHCTDSLDRLRPFSVADSMSVEHRWMQQRLMTVPEWISGVREQLSVSYAGLGHMQAAAYNRNIYLDILEATRQDKEWESRYAQLTAESAYLTWLLVCLCSSVLLLTCTFWLFHRNAKRRQRRHLLRLQQILQLCRKIVASVPVVASTEAEQHEKLLRLIAPELQQLFPLKTFTIEDDVLYPNQVCRRDEQAMLEVINPYISWAVSNGHTSLVLTEELEQQEELREVHRAQIARRKRSNLLKKTCVAVVDSIQPYIDRILHEVQALQRAEDIKLTEADCRYKLEYIDELLTTINERNELLTQWIKMKQGALNLNIENFELNPLFDLLRKGSHTFEMKKLKLTVEPTDACIKADRALTLFMMNTLTDNARKFTPEGGSVSVYARTGEHYVEISIADTGCGYSPDNGVNSSAKGTGFGLMNCRGIIEKYKKIGSIFEVAKLDVESKPGEGSRFYFRLPTGVRKVVMMLLLSVGINLWAAPAAVNEQTYEIMLNRASDYANEAYFSNIDGEYEQALAYIDSAMLQLNEHYQCYGATQLTPMKVCDAAPPAELLWWNERFDTDYHVILDLRNEAAVAFLALNCHDAYDYNNRAYTSLFKLLGEDYQLEAFCIRLKESATRKQLMVALLVLVLCAMPVGYYLIYLKRMLRQRSNLHRVVLMNRDIFSHDGPLTDMHQTLLAHSTEINELYQSILQSACDAVAKINHQNRDVEQVHDEANRAQWEDNQLHVQNQVLDNCLSTIKHETAYYPNKIKLMVEGALAAPAVSVHDRTTVNSIAELVEYYKGVFTTLSACAARQLEDVTFRRSRLRVSEIARTAEQYFNSRVKGITMALTFRTVYDKVDDRMEVTGDEHQLHFLFENLIDEALQSTACKKGELILSITSCDAGFLTFMFTDTRRNLSQDDLRRLFYPQSGIGMQYLICKQIIREHDEYTGFRGCRIEAVPAKQGEGFSVRMTLPRA